jgi:hypothetical protein
MKQPRKILTSLIILTILISLFSPDVAAQTHYKLNTKKELIIIGSGLVIGGMGTYFTQKINPLTMKEIYNLSRQDVNAFDRPATYNYSKSATRWSDILVGSCIIFPTTLLSQKLIREDWQTFSMMYLQTLMFSNFIPMVSKGRVQRIRPYVYNEDAPLEKKMDTNAKLSFYSGHTTNAFASSVFFSTTYSHYYPNSRWKPYIWTASLGLATVVGYLRFEAGKHFPSDILLGALVGSVIGYFVPYLHRAENSGNSAELSFAPLQNVGFQMRFNF